MKFSRLWQPRNPAFWMMLALNILSSILAWVLRSYPLVPLAMAVVAGFALMNAWLGLRLAIGLMREEPDAPGANER